MDKAHSLSGGSDDTKETDVSQQASTTDQEAFDTMLGKSQLIDQLQTDVGTVKTQVCSIIASVDSIQSEQESNFGRLETLVIIKVFRILSILWILRSLGCFIASIGTPAQQLALDSAQSTAEVSDNHFGQCVMRQLFASLAATTPVVTPPGIIDSVQLVPQAVKNLAISDVTPLIDGASILIANVVIKRMLKF